MKQFFVILSLCVFFIAPARSDFIEKLDDGFFRVMHLREASGRAQPPRGDKGKSVGPYMIGQLYLDDVNETYGTSYTLEDCESSEPVSRWVVIHFMKKYCNEKWLGYEPTVYDAYLLHNGGPSAPFKDGAINKHGRLPKTKRALERAKLCQKNAPVYARSCLKIAREENIELK